MTPATLTQTASHGAPAALPWWRASAEATHGRFVGAEHGSPVSGFVVDAADGEGPGLHWHPYAETFVVLHGRGRFFRGEEVLEAAAGDLVVVPPHTLHRFEAVGPERLRCVAIHGSPTMDQTFVD
jgi:mannose-6-phosphate isomerase-like protein (cupin superfamily)